MLAEFMESLLIILPRPRPTSNSNNILSNSRTMATTTSTSGLCISKLWRIVSPSKCGVQDISIIMEKLPPPIRPAG